MAMRDEVGSGPGGAELWKALVGLSEGLSLTLSTRISYLRATWNSSSRSCNSIFWLSCIHVAYTHADINAEVIKMKTKSFKMKNVGRAVLIMGLLTRQEILGTIVYRNLNVGDTISQAWVPEKLKWRKMSRPAQPFIAASLLTIWIQCEHSPQAVTTMTAPPQVPKH